MGHEGRLLPILQIDAHLLSEFHRSEEGKTVYILSDHALGTFGSTIRILMRSPRRFCNGVLLALRTAPAGIKGIVWQTAYLFEAMFLADSMVRLGIQHLHNHNAESSGSVAMLTS